MMSARARLALVASIGAAVTLIAAIIWLESRPDVVLARWSAIAGVISAVVAVLALVVALVPLRLPSKANDADTGRSAGTAPEPVSPTGVKQNISVKGPTQVVGKGNITNNFNSWRGR